MKRTLKAVKGHTYGAKFRKPGDIYEANRTDANLMVLLKNSEYYSPPVAVVAKAPEKVEPNKPRRASTRRNPAAQKVEGYDTKVMTAD